MKIKFIILALLALIAVGMVSSEDDDITLNESSPIFWYNKGESLLNSGKYNESIEAYNKAIELDPQDASAWFMKGYTLFELGKYEESIKLFEKVIELDQDPRSTRYCETQYKKGLALNALGRNSDAKAAFSKTNYIMPAWMEFVTFTRGEGFDGLLILYNNYDLSTGCDGRLRVELYEDRDYTKKVWSGSFDVKRDDFDTYTWGFGRKERAWHMKRTAFDDIKPGMEKTVRLYVRAYFDTLDGRTLKDTTII